VQPTWASAPKCRKQGSVITEGKSSAVHSRHVSTSAMNSSSLLQLGQGLGMIARRCRIPTMTVAIGSTKQYSINRRRSAHCERLAICRLATPLPPAFRLRIVRREGRGNRVHLGPDVVRHGRVEEVNR